MMKCYVEPDALSVAIKGINRCVQSMLAKVLWHVQEELLKKSAMKVQKTFVKDEFKIQKSQANEEFV